MESFILSVGANTRTFEQDVIAGARRAEKALVFRPKVDTSGIERFTGPLGRINSQATEFNKSLEASNARVIAFGASAGAIFAIQKALQGVIRDAINVEKVFADINSVLGQSEAGLKKFKDQVFDTARATGSSFKVASEAALELSRQGLTAEASAKRLGAALILARLGGLDAKDAVEGLTAAINSFSKEALDDVDVVNKLANISAKFAVSEKDLTEAIKRSASAASDAGVNFNELTALVTAAQQTTARGGAVIGNSLKTIFTRLQRSDTLDQLEALGIATKDVSGKLLGAQQILINLAGVYKDLSQEQQSFISELTGGLFQINQLKAQLTDLGKSYGFYQRALTEVNKTTDEAIKRNEELNKTTSATLNAISVSLTELGSKLGSEMFGPLIKKVSGSADSLFELLNTKAEEGGKTIGETLGKAIGGVLSGPGLILGVAIVGTLFAKLAKFGIDAGKSVIDIVSGAERQKKVQAEIQMILQQSGKSYAEIVSGAKSLEEIERRILGIIREQLAAKESFQSLTSNLAPGLTSGGGFSLGQGKLKEAGLKYSGGRVALGVQRFGDPLREAIEREKRGGVPASSIYIDSDPRLKSPSNPLGLLVANKKDEPLGGFQGVNRAISMGIDPKKHGGGFVPNFAEFDKTERLRPAGKVKDVFGNVTILAGEEKLMAYEAKKLRSLASSIRMAANAQDFAKASKEFTEYAKTLNLTQAGLVKVGQVIKNAGAKLGKALAERAFEAQVIAEKEKISYELASIQAKKLEKENAIRAKAFEKARPALEKSLSIEKQLALAPSNRTKTLSPDEKARQLGFVSPVKNAEGLSTADERALDNLNREQARQDRANRKMKEARQREIAIQRAKIAASEAEAASKIVDFSKVKIIRNGGSGVASQAAFLATQQQSTGSVAQPGTLSPFISPNAYIGTNQFTGFRLPRFPRETFVESALNRDLFNMPLSELSKVSGKSSMASRPEDIRSIRKQINSYRGKNIDYNFIGRVGSIAGTKETFQSQFEKTAKAQILKGNSFTDSFAFAAAELKKTGGSTKQLRDAIVNTALPVVEFQQELKDQRAMLERKTAIMGINSKLESTGGDLGSLDRSQRGLLRGIAKDQAIKNLGFEGIEPSILAESKKTQRLIAIETGKVFKSFGADQNIKKFDAILSDTFNQRSGGLSGVFGRKDNDLKALMSRLPSGTKLSSEQLIAFQSRQQSLQQQRASRVTNIGIAGSFLTSALAGSGAFGNGMAGGIAQGAATGSSIGSFFGLPGIVAGGVIGGVGGGISAKSEEPRKNFEKAAKAFQDLSSELNNNVQSVQGYIVAQEHLNDLIKSGTAKESDISNLNKQMSDLFKSITDSKTRSDILNAAGNIDKINEALDRLASQNSKRIAKEGVNLVIASTNSETVGGFAGIGTSIKTDNLKKVGQAIANASDITAENLNKLKNSFNKLQSGADINEVSSALAKFGVDTTGLKTDVNGLLIVLRNAIDNKQFEASLNERSKIDQGYPLQLQKYNKDYEKIVTDVDNLRSLRIAQEFANKRVILAGKGENEKLVTGTSLSLFDRSANLSINSLELQKQKEFSDLNSSGRGRLSSFVVDNLKAGESKKAILETLNNPSLNINVIDELKKLQDIDEKSFENAGKANDELGSLLSSMLQSANELAQKQNEQTAILKNQLEIEKEMLKRRDLLSAFGGSGSLGQGINTDSIRRGFSAGGAVGISDRELASRRYLFKEDRQAANYASRGSRISEAQGLIQLGNMLPEAVDAFRTPENTARIQKANEADILNKNNQVFLSSIQGFFEGEFSKGGAFSTGSQYQNGGKLQRDLMEALRGTDGGRDFSKLSKIVEESQLGVRSPDAYRRLKGIIGTAGQVAGKAGEIATLRTADQFKTPAMREQEALTTSMNIADNTKATVIAIKNLQEVLAERQAVLTVGEAGKKAESYKNELEKLKNTAQTRLEEAKKEINIDANFEGFFKTKQKADSILDNLTGGGYSKTSKNNSDTQFIIGEAVKEIAKGGKVENITSRLQKIDKAGKLIRVIGQEKGESSDQTLGRFVTKFASEQQQSSLSQFEKEANKYNSAIKEAAKKAKSLADLYTEAELSLKEFVERTKGTTSVTGSTPTQSNDRIFNLNAKDSVSNKILNSARGVTEAQSAIDSGSYTAKEAEIVKNKATGNFAKSVKGGLDQDGALAIAGVFSQAFKEAIIGTQPEVKAQVQQDIKTQFDIVLKDGRINPEEIKQLQAAITKATEDILILKNGGKAENGSNTSPATAKPVASGATR